MKVYKGHVVDNDNFFEDGSTIRVCLTNNRDIADYWILPVDKFELADKKIKIVRSFEAPQATVYICSSSEYIYKKDDLKSSNTTNYSSGESLISKFFKTLENSTGKGVELTKPQALLMSVISFVIMALVMIYLPKAVLYFGIDGFSMIIKVVLYVVQFVIGGIAGFIGLGGLTELTEGFFDFPVKKIKPFALGLIIQILLTVIFVAIAITGVLIFLYRPDEFTYKINAFLIEALLVIVGVSGAAAFMFSCFDYNKGRYEKNKNIISVIIALIGIILVVASFFTVKISIETRNINKVNDMIDVLPDEYSEEYDSDISKADFEYNELTEKEKSKVENIDKLLELVEKKELNRKKKQMIKGLY